MVWCVITDSAFSDDRSVMKPRHLTLKHGEAAPASSHAGGGGGGAMDLFKQKKKIVLKGAKWGRDELVDPHHTRHNSAVAAAMHHSTAHGRAGSILQSNSPSPQPISPSPMSAGGGGSGLAPVGVNRSASATAGSGTTGFATARERECKIMR